MEAVLPQNLLRSDGPEELRREPIKSCVIFLTYIAQSENRNTLESAVEVEELGDLCVTIFCAAQ